MIFFFRRNCNVFWEKLCNFFVRKRIKYLSIQANYSFHHIRYQVGGKVTLSFGWVVSTHWLTLSVKLFPSYYVPGRVKGNYIVALSTMNMRKSVVIPQLSKSRSMTCLPPTSFTRNKCLFKCVSRLYKDKVID